MLARSWIALLLFANYLLVVGAGGMNRPEDQRELIVVQTRAEGQLYQQCRYLRMDGLEAFLTEALVAHYQNAPDHAPHHLLSVISGIDAHYLSVLFWSVPCLLGQVVVHLVSHRNLPTLRVYPSIDTPPW